MSDEDLQSIIAYLRSDAAPVQPAAIAAPAPVPSLLVKFLCRVAFKPFPYPKNPVAAPDPANKVAYGRYIATGAVECFHCHSEDFKTINDLEPEKTPGYMGGGNMLLDPDGNEVFSANITMHPEHGIGQWTEEEFVHCVQFGVRPDGTTVSPAMPKFSVMTEEEARAVWAYLQTVPLQDKEVLRASR